MGLSVDKPFEPCPECAEARAGGDHEAAVTCRGCEGKGLRRVPSSYVCNACGGTMLPERGGPNEERPHGLVETTVTGAYESFHLFDQSAYEFSLCEPCLRGLFDSFAIPPRLYDSNVRGDQSPAALTYAEETIRYQDRLWVRDGGARERLLAGGCTATRRCGERATVRRYSSDQITDDAYCEAHRASDMTMGGWFVPVDEVREVVHVRGERTTAELRIAAEAWLRSILGRSPEPLYWRWVPGVLGDLLGLDLGLDVEAAEHPSTVYVPEGQRIPVWVLPSEGRRESLLGGRIFVGAGMKPPKGDPIRRPSVEHLADWERRLETQGDG